MGDTLAADLSSCRALTCAPAREPHAAAARSLTGRGKTRNRADSTAHAGFAASPASSGVRRMKG
ncbi:hypothetical protein BSIN_2558 [Burkholderia singularis]|uniref:Uncharacterized protein n=1 Tax=Burkholderia singularis TaxID=1503053 RepID=A0A238H2X3_9BURK|nr:hypothetical protein BSIN_2558 [Burkholderia singularis]